MQSFRNAGCTKCQVIGICVKAKQSYKKGEGQSLYTHKNM